MKNLILILLSVVFFACNKLPANGSGNNNSNNTEKIKAKVVRITCASTTIEILDASHYDLGVSWTMEGTANTYEHVAVVANKCEFPSNLKEGDTFYFQVINESDASNDCAVCMMYDFPPSKSIFLKVVN
jgi:hypothetical protein